MWDQAGTMQRGEKKITMNPITAVWMRNINAICIPFPIHMWTGLQVFRRNWVKVEEDNNRQDNRTTVPYQILYRPVFSSQETPGKISSTNWPEKSLVAILLSLLYIQLNLNWFDFPKQSTWSETCWEMRCGCSGYIMPMADLKNIF